MIYLILKFTFIFLLTTLIGFLLGRWWVRRTFVDVTDSYQMLSSSSSDKQWDKVWEKFDIQNHSIEAIVQREFNKQPSVNLDEIREQVLSLENSVNQKFMTFSKPQAVDLSSLIEQNKQLGAAVAAIPKPTDLSALENRVTKVADMVGKLPQPKPTDLSALENRVDKVADMVSKLPQPKSTDLSALHDQLKHLETLITCIPQPTAAEPADLSWLGNSLTEIKQEIAAQPAPTDLTPVTDKINRLEQLVTSIPSPTPVDLSLLDASLDGIKQDIASLPRASAELDLNPVYNHFEQLETLIETKLQNNETGDLSLLTERLDSLDRSLLAVPEKAAALNFEPVNTRIDALESVIGSIPLPAPQEPVDLTPTNQKISELESLIKAMPKPEEVNLSSLYERVEYLQLLLESTPQNTQTNLTPVHEQIKDLEALINAQPTYQETKPIDITPISQKLVSLETALSQLPQGPDLSPVHARLDTIEANIEELLKQKKTAPTVQAPTTVTEAPKLLKSASFGKKDDLKRISGVGPKLETLLNKHGVYYFWQIDTWTAANIQAMDDRLDVFKGRIERDNWVAQARSFSAEPETANRPAEA